MNKKTIVYSVLTIVIGITIVSPCSGGSIWAKRDKDMPRLYADDSARKIGDVLTIVVSEDSKVDNKAKRDLKKESSRSASFDGSVGFTTPGHNILPRVPGFTMDAESDSELKGKADYKDERSFVDRITVMVEDVLPNGNLVVIGTRHRDIAGDKQVIQASGIVRPSDIAYDNTIKSEQVANFRILTKNSGVSEPYSRQGWLARLFDLLSPF